MYTTESFKNHKSGILNKFIQNSNKEKVIKQNHLAFMKLLASTVKIKVHIQMLNEFSNGVPVSVGLLQIKIVMKLIYLNESSSVFNSCPVALVSIRSLNYCISVSFTEVLMCPFNWFFLKINCIFIITILWLCNPPDQYSFHCCIHLLRILCYYRIKIYNRYKIT